MKDHLLCDTTYTKGPSRQSDKESRLVLVRGQEEPGITTNVYKGFF